MRNRTETSKKAAPTEVSISGMSCQGCARNATNAIQAVEGVVSAAVELDPGHATIRWRTGARDNVAAVLSAIERAGFRAKVATPAQTRAAPSKWSPLAGWRFNVVFGGAVTLALGLGEWGLGLGVERWFQWLAFGLALPVQLVCGARFYRGAWNQLKVGKSNMDTLVALGSTAAFAYSTWALFAGWSTHLYFMESVGIVTLISAGHWIEANVGEKAASSLRALLDLAPPTAMRLNAEGVESKVLVAQLVENDRVRLKPGDRVPTDGVIVQGDSAIDESMLTGESMPVEKSERALVYAGTVNLNGRLVVRVSATGEATALAQIIEVVRRAQSSRANIQRVADRVSSVFVPLVVLVAILTALWWGLAYDSAGDLARNLMPFLWAVSIPDSALAAAFIHAAAVLIVACPCAMGLATPAALMAGANAAARRGILIRDAHALEKTGHITAVIFDKTGTLTAGRPTVAAVEDPRPPALGGERIEALVDKLVRPSNHPLSRALAEWAGSRLTAPPERAFPDKPKAPAGPDEMVGWRELRGCGVQASSANTVLRLGSTAWLDQCGVRTKQRPEFEDHWTARGATVLGLAADTALLGVFALRDVLKPNAPEVVKQLRNTGKSVYLITGDNPRTALAIAHQAGIANENVFAEVAPEKKADIVADLQNRGEQVAFVGDGINDAPALEQAHLGIAVSRASDVAREAADLILLRSDIDALPEALGLARATLRTIKQNLFWAFFYNAAAVPLAALGFLSPIVCAAAMGVSDLIVIGNALRLRSWKP